MSVKVWLTLAAEALIFSVLLFAAAGTIFWPAGWAYLLVFFVAAVRLTLMLAKHDPALLAERMKSPLQKGQPFWDKVFLLGMIVAWCGWLVLMGLDAVRFHWSVMPLWLQFAGGALMVLSIALGSAMCGRAEAATLCVNHAGSGSCFSSIGAAVAAASPNDTIKVADGTYKEDVIIDKSLSLMGASQKRTIIDASRLSNGIYIDGIDNPGLSNVVVSNFKVENANFEGILVANASSVTIKNCMILLNDRNQTTAPSCPGIPSFETGESFDCGEGLHLTGVDHSTVSNNTVEENTGGILLTDDTGTTHDNVITGNIVMNNPFDCGITLASHPAAALTGSSSPLGVFNNTIAANSSLNNGLFVPGAGAIRAVGRISAVVYLVLVIAVCCGIEGALRRSRRRPTARTAMPNGWPSCGAAWPPSSGASPPAACGSSRCTGRASSPTAAAAS